MPQRDRLPRTLRAYRRVVRLATPFTGLLLSYRRRRGKEDAARVGERRGIASLPRPQGPLIWTHAASVGEVLSVMPLLERIRPLGFPLLLSCHTVTAARLVEQRLPAGVQHQFVPLDTPSFVNRFLDHWRPSLALLAESELWPNLIIETTRRGVPLVLVNARLSQRSFDRWQIARTAAADLLSRIDLCLAQSADDARRLTELGAPRVQMTGNLKFDAPPPPADPGALADLQRTTSGRPMVLAASTHPGEEAAVLKAHQRLRQKIPGLLTVIAPRHPERGGQIVELAEAAGLTPVMRSRGHLPDRGTDIYVADTIGELGLFYRLAPIVFMGGSLVRHGGQNPIEPAKLDCAILYGPHVANFAAIYEQLNRARAAALVSDADSLARSFELLLDDQDLVRRMAAAARATVEQLGGALDRTYQTIEPYLIGLKLEH
jgi:3-deoxy-D-manno-octulosonic-acid transferase